MIQYFEFNILLSIKVSKNKLVKESLKKTKIKIFLSIGSFKCIFSKILIY